MANVNCSVLLNTCDKYEDAWYPFFELTKKYWGGCQYPFYLNTEKKNYTHSGIDLTVINPSSDESEAISWGMRLRHCLSNIKTKYVILLLEDFFFQAPVNQQEIDSCIQMMDANERIKAIYFKQIDGYQTVYSENPNYFIMSEQKRYILNLQAGLWKTEELTSLIGEIDSPWSFEEEGSSRVSKEDIFLCSTRGTHKDMSNCAFPYLTDRRTGYGIWAGKWLWNNNSLFKRNGIEVKNISLEKFTRFDMLNYYMHRIREGISGKTKK